MNIRYHRMAATIASVAVGIIPVFILIQYFGVPRKLILGWGVLSYVTGVTAVKMPLYHFFVVRFLHGRLSNLWLGVSQGLVSGVAELGTAFAFFVFVVPDMNLAELIGFGAAAGAVEAVVLPFIGNPLKGTPLEEHSFSVDRKSSGNRLIPWMGVAERILAFFPHVAGRGLVYVGFLTGNVAPAVIGILLFAAIDGRAYYAHLERWAFDDIRVLSRFYRYLAAVGVADAGCFAFLYYYLV